ncbi:MAG TPA: NAD-dependent epimerase/dehydratase family protein, partial [Gemmatimonadaceae bacterium]|nr:NAD-dependent epimerase/dehydratase family protein [Gemmatimonadaceae bacterium]
TAVVRDAGAFAARHPHLAPAVALVAGDVRTAAVPRSATHVVHCASAASPAMNAERPDEVVDIIVAGTDHMLTAAEHAAARGDGVRFLHLSSGSVYGPQPATLERIPETFAGHADPASPAQRFGAAKLAAERRGAIATSRGVRFTVARGFAMIGPRLPLDGAFAIGNFIGDALAGRPVEVRGDGTPVRSWLHAADVAAWCWTILACGAAGAVYNVGSDEAVTIGDAAARIAARAVPPVPVRCLGQGAPGAPPSRYVPDVECARHALGLRVRIPLDDAIARTMAWWRQ